MQHKILIFFFFLKKWKLQLNDCALTPRQDSGQLFAVAVLSRQCYLWLCQQAARCSSRSPSALDMRFTCAPAKLRHRRCHRSGQDQVSRNKRTPARFISEITSEKPVFFSPIISLARGSALRVRLLRPDLLRCGLRASLRTQRASANNPVSLPVASTRGLFTGSPGGNEGSPDKQSYDAAIMPGPDFSSFSPSCPPGCLSCLSLLPPLGRGPCRHGNLSLLTQGTRRLPLLFMRWRDPLCQPSPGGVCRALLPFLSLSARGG